MAKKIDPKPYLNFFRKREVTSLEFANRFELSIAMARRRISEFRSKLVIVGYTEPEGKGKGMPKYTFRTSKEQVDTPHPSRGLKLTGVERVNRAKEKRLRLLAAKRDLDLLKATTKKEKAEIQRKYNWDCGNVKKRYILQGQKLREYHREYQKIRRRIDKEASGFKTLIGTWNSALSNTRQMEATV